MINHAVLRIRVCNILYLYLMGFRKHLELVGQISVGSNPQIYPYHPTLSPTQIPLCPAVILDTAESLSHLCVSFRLGKLGFEVDDFNRWCSF